MPFTAPLPAEIRAAEERVQVKAILNVELLQEKLTLDALSDGMTTANRVAIAEFNYKLSKLAQTKAVEVARAGRPITSIHYPDGSIVAIGGAGDTQTLAGPSPHSTPSNRVVAPAAADETVGTTDSDPVLLESEASTLALPTPPKFISRYVRRHTSVLEYDDDLVQEAA